MQHLLCKNLWKGYAVRTKNDYRRKEARKRSQSRRVRAAENFVRQLQV